MSKKAIAAFVVWGLTASCIVLLAITADKKPKSTSTVAADTSESVAAEAPKPPSSVRIGEWAIVDSVLNNYLCPAVADIERYRQLFRPDIGAAVQHLKEQHCRWINADAEVMIEDSNARAPGYVCARPKGETHCMWIEKDKVATKEEIANRKAEVVDEIDRRFNAVNPECKEWKTRKDLPDYCY